ncbi:MFS transporter [Arthrobacter sp. ok362]|uniref:MFS transporter n=1 Tax=Arthrobacter sp. ok362 TaxID=1761745 RepID=UPI00087F563E|nr:MFS transporter [Arthrobacter sp. ok362]SDL39333.1 Predicted arabinose efflux permease, MFS family [Arthrobacter sp. ok362]
MDGEDQATLPRQRSLWRHRGFLLLWGAESISELGAQFSILALPLLAVSVLGADEWQLGVLNAAGTAAFFVVGLPAGAWVDRWLKRRVMIFADVVRALAIAVVPVLWWLGSLQLWHLAAVAAVVGIGTVFFDVSYQSYVPVLVAGQQVADANSKLEASFQTARIAGPALAGALLAIAAAPLLLVWDSLSYLFSAALLWRVKDGEVRADRSARRRLASEIAEGVRYVAREPVIRRVVGTTATSNLFSTLTFTLLPLLVLRELHLGAAGLGLILSVGAVGGLLGAVATPYLSRQVGEGRIISVSAVAVALMLALIPWAATAPAYSLPVLLAAEFGLSFAGMTYNITQVSLRQRLCPPHLLGRMNASIRFVVWGVMPFSSLGAGLLGDRLGMLATMWIAAAGALLGCAFVVFSPLTGMRSLPVGSPAAQVPQRADSA